MRRRWFGLGYLIAEIAGRVSIRRQRKSFPHRVHIIRIEQW